MGGTVTIVGQEYASEARSAYTSFAQLQALLTQGWEIETPVYVRPLWHHNDSRSYHFVLLKGARVRLISVVDGPEIQQFLAGKAFELNRL